MSEKAKSKTEVKEDATLNNEKFMMEKLSSIENCCKTIKESMSSIGFNIAGINQKIPPMLTMMPGMGMPGMNPMGMDPQMGMGIGINPMMFNQMADMLTNTKLMLKNEQEKLKKLEKAYTEATDPEKIRNKLKIIADKESMTTEDKEYVLDALDMILLTGVEVARILDKVDLVIIDGDKPEKKEHARSSLEKVVADINKISTKWRRVSKKSSSSKSKEVIEDSVKLKK